MKRGAQPGNDNAAKGKVWEGAIRRGLAKDRERLNRIAEQVLCAAEKGEQWAVTEVRNTLDGKPKEHVQVTHTEKRRLSYAERVAKESAATAAGAPKGAVVNTVQ